MKKLLILSGKGGTGKTTTAAAFVAFSGAGAVADCDVDAPNLHLALKQTAAGEERDFYGGKKAVVDQTVCTSCGACVTHCRFDAVTLTALGAKVNEIACEGCGVCRLVCPAHAVRLEEDVAGRLTLIRGKPTFSTAELKMGRGNSGKLVTDVKFALYTAAPREPLAVIDGSPGIGCPVIASVSGVDLVLVVAEPSVSGLSDLERLCRTAGVLQVKMAVCVNKFDISPEKTHEIEVFCREKGIPFAGKIPFDKTVSRAINQGLSLAATPCPARDALYDLYQKTMLLLEAN